MSEIKNIFVLIKQVPDQGSKAGLNPDGTINRAKAKRMLNPFDRFALQAALHTKNTYGGKVIALTMGPPPAEEILLGALEQGVDQCYLLSDRRLAASDTYATSYALKAAVDYLTKNVVGDFQLMFCGLQTTDGDTAQIGPQMAERLDVPQVTYCEDFRVEGGQVVARRVIEGGYQWVESSLPCVVTVANSYTPLEYKSLRGARMAQRLIASPDEKAKYIHILDLDKVEANPVKTGLAGSPTIVATTEKVADIGGSCVMQQGAPIGEMVDSVIDGAGLKEYIS